MEKFLDLRKKYNTFKYIDYKYTEDMDNIYITYYYEIVGLDSFIHKITIEKRNINKPRNTETYKLEYDNLIFNLGMIEIINYIKITCSENIIVSCGYLDEYQIDWFKKLYYNGLGEFRYINKIDISEKDFFEITCDNIDKKQSIISVKEYKNKGNLIPIGGGKDSIVTVELLKEMQNKYVILNPRGATISTIEIIDNGEYDTIFLNRILDEKIYDLNNQGFLNGHIPFSAMLAFLTYLVAFVAHKEYVVLSNESSANEPNIPNTKINHQYSKSFEFENDFINYTKKYLNYNIKYFSFLRPINELQITKIFSKFKNYHGIFKSCNQGSKTDSWCNNCPKCLFVYIMLNIYLEEKDLVNIFKENLLEKESLLQTFLELIGKSNNKPFECVGTIDEVNFAVKKAIENLDKQGKHDIIKYPYMLKYYKENYEYKIEDEKENILKIYDDKNNLPEDYNNILKGEVLND